jgi:hypothetical protein
MSPRLVDYIYTQIFSPFSKRNFKGTCLLCLPSQNTDITWRCRRLNISNKNIYSLAAEATFRKRYVTKSKFLMHMCTLSPFFQMRAPALHVCPLSLLKNLQGSFMGSFFSQIQTLDVHVCFVCLINTKKTPSMGCFFSFFSK